MKLIILLLLLLIGVVAILLPRLKTLAPVNTAEETLAPLNTPDPEIVRSDAASIIQRSWRRRKTLAPVNTPEVSLAQSVQLAAALRIQKSWRKKATCSICSRRRYRAVMVPNGMTPQGRHMGPHCVLCNLRMERFHRNLPPVDD
jgi:hypothetical protein